LIFFLSQHILYWKVMANYTLENIPLKTLHEERGHYGFT
jgi:hypothetical protein